MPIPVAAFNLYHTNTYDEYDLDHNVQTFLDAVTQSFLT